MLIPIGANRTDDHQFTRYRNAGRAKLSAHEVRFALQLFAYSLTAIPFHALREGYGLRGAALATGYALLQSWEHWEHWDQL